MRTDDGDARVQVRLEADSEEAKKKRLVEKKARREARQAKREAEKVKQERERKEAEEWERLWTEELTKARKAVNERAAREADREKAMDEAEAPVVAAVEDSQSIPAAVPSALATACMIEDIDRIEYPEGVNGPEPGLNVNAKQGIFRCAHFSSRISWKY